MRNAYSTTWNMERKLKNMQNDTQTLNNLIHGAKP